MLQSDSICSFTTVLYVHLLLASSVRTVVLWRLDASELVGVSLVSTCVCVLNDGVPPCSNCRAAWPANFMLVWGKYQMAYQAAAILLCRWSCARSCCAVVAGCLARGKQAWHVANTTPTVAMCVPSAKQALPGPAADSSMARSFDTAGVILELGLVCLLQGRAGNPGQGHGVLHGVRGGGDQAHGCMVQGRRRGATCRRAKCTVVW